VRSQGCTTNTTWARGQQLPPPTLAQLSAAGARARTSVLQLSPLSLLCFHVQTLLMMLCRGWPCVCTLCHPRSLLSLLGRDVDSRTLESDALLLRFMCLPPLSLTMRQVPVSAWHGAARAATLRSWPAGATVCTQVRQHTPARTNTARSRVLAGSRPSPPLQQAPL
jgi:hypothetical protein